LRRSPFQDLQMETETSPYLQGLLSSPDLHTFSILICSVDYSLLLLCLSRSCFTVFIIQSCTWPPVWNFDEPSSTWQRSCQPNFVLRSVSKYYLFSSILLTLIVHLSIFCPPVVAVVNSPHDPDPSSPLLPSPR
jgi:hypothetical protein